MARFSAVAFAAVLAALLFLQNAHAAATGKCPVTVTIKPEDVPTVCNSKTTSEVCGSCLTQVIDKVRWRLCASDFVSAPSVAIMAAARPPRSVAALFNRKAAAAMR